MRDKILETEKIGKINKKTKKNHFLPKKNSFN